MYPWYVPSWRKAPFIRFLPPLMTGILLQWYFQPRVAMAWISLLLASLVLIISFLFSGYRSYRLTVTTGIAVTIAFLSIGSLLTWYRDIRHYELWFGAHYHEGNWVMAELKEPLTEKTNSLKALANVVTIGDDTKAAPTTGDIILYFKKDSALPHLNPGSRIIFSQPLQQVKNTGNPGGFDYKRYCLFQGITHQVYLRPGEFVAIDKKQPGWLNRTLQEVRETVLGILRKYIPGEKERGLAEALLIGYKDDLDRNLVQSYTNTGVVHIIAISGLHLGLIYWLLVLVFKPFKKYMLFKWIIPVVIISALWLFSLLAGGQPSVLRSAVMFTCIVLAENIARKTSIYNTLAFSAFILLCYDPFWVFDVGFQLSYSAVLSIVIFMKPIYNWFYIKNKLLDLTWKLNAVSIAAQLLTTPFSIYHFHQFPNYFLLTNFIAIPLSSCIVLGEILLCAISLFPFLAALCGSLLSWLIWVMNSYIERIEALPGSMSGGIQIEVLQAVFLLILAAGLGWMFLEKRKMGLWSAIAALLFFVLVRFYSLYKVGTQQKIVVYNIPKHQAIDVVIGRKYFFIGDSDLLADDYLTNFHLKPARVLNQVELIHDSVGCYYHDNFLSCGSKRIFIVDTAVSFALPEQRITLDLLVVSKNPKIYLSTLVKSFAIKMVVFDASASSRKIKYWKKDCDSLHIPYHDVGEKGAFVMSVN